MKNTDLKYLRKIIIRSQLGLERINDKEIFLNNNGTHAAESLIKISIAVEIILKKNKWHAKDVAKIRSALLANTTEIKINLPNYSINPLIEEFMAVAKEMREKNGNSRNITEEKILEIASALAKKLTSRELKRRNSNYTRTARDNCKELREHVDKILAKHSRLLVVRVDLAYTLKHLRTTKSDIKNEPDLIRSDLKKLLRSISRSKKINMAGYVWKLEHGLFKGPHYHIAFFFDGAQHREDISLGKAIGEKWIEITKNFGTYHNCNVKKESYQDCGIGMVSHLDKEKIDGLHKAISYLAKQEFYLKIKTGRSLGKSVSPTPHSGKGRPRSAERKTNA